MILFIGIYLYLINYLFIKQNKEYFKPEVINKKLFNVVLIAIIWELSRFSLINASSIMVANYVYNNIVIFIILLSLSVFYLCIGTDISKVVNIKRYKRCMLISMIIGISFTVSLLCRLYIAIDKFSL